jgi:hypothetical protein
MIRINVMRPFLNRLKDRGWKKVSRGITDNIQVLRRGDIKIVVENISIDASVDIRPQISEFFERLIEIILKADAKEIFLPGGGDVPIPEFFKEFCRENGIDINILTNESVREYSNYN